MSRHVVCAVIVPALAAAAAFPWALPEPTFVIPAVDDWSPAPTKAPNAASIELFKRAPEVCGYISGLESSVIGCNDASNVCATNAYYGVHGCCPPESKALSDCNIPTTCIPSSSMSAKCTNSKCSADGYITKCTGTEAPECQKWLFVYDSATTTTLTEWRCGSEATTATVERTYHGQSVSRSTSITSESETSTETTATSSTPPAAASPVLATQPSKQNNTGPIIGGAIGGLVVLGAIVCVIIYLILRHRRQKREAAAHQSWLSAQSGVVPGVTEYNPHGFSGSTWQEQQDKSWKDQRSPYISDCGDERAGLGGRGQATLFGVVETAGTPLNEAPT